MSLANTLLVESTKIVWGAAPIDITGAGLSGDWVNLKNHRKLAIILMSGAWAGGTSAITVEEATDNAGTGGQALAFAYQYVATGLTSDTLVKTAVTSNTFNVAAANKIHVIELLAADLSAGFTHVRVVAGTPGSNADLLAALYVLYSGSYLEKVSTMPSAIS